MKKIIILILSALTFAACTDKNVVKQHIMGAGDCMYNSGWSWNNGMATADGECEYGEYHHFSFSAKPSGKLTFSYKFNYDGEYHSYDEDYGYLAIAVGSDSYFKEELFHRDEDSKLKWTNVDVGSVESGDLIVVRGYNCSIKDIMVEGILPITEDTIPSSNTPWDF